MAIDGTLSGLIVLADRLRSDAAALLTDLREAGVGRIVLASGDRLEIAAAVGKTLGLDLVLGDLSPDAKVEAIQASGPMMMVGDGVNDAPALAAADIGFAMGMRNSLLVRGRRCGSARR